MLEIHIKRTSEKMRGELAAFIRKYAETSSKNPKTYRELAEEFFGAGFEQKHVDRMRATVYRMRVTG